MHSYLRSLKSFCLIFDSVFLPEIPNIEGYLYLMEALKPILGVEHQRAKLADGWKIVYLFICDFQFFMNHLLLRH